jgi:hypothetical protein
MRSRGTGGGRQYYVPPVSTRSMGLRSAREGADVPVELGARKLLGNADTDTPCQYRASVERPPEPLDEVLKLRHVC